MPANLTPGYLAAEQSFKEARTTEEKLLALEEMLSTIPKHKGTEKMQADIKRRISKLRAESGRKSGPAKAAPVYQVEKEGAGQVVLVGPPNSGKSLVVSRLTHARPEVADYPFTTRLPLPGMMPFENIQMQLVDLPPVHPDFAEAWLPQVIRYADAALLVMDLASPELLEEFDVTLAHLEKSKIRLGSGAAELPPGSVAKPALVVANKTDFAEAKENLELLREFVAGRFSLLAISALQGAGLEELKRAVFDLLGIIRVYSKPPGKKVDRDAPFVLRHGSTVVDLAGRVHKDFLTTLKYARVWGHGRFDGQMVERHYVLEDGDVVELHD